MILYTENPQDSNKKLPELINEFSKIAGYKVNIQNSVAFFSHKKSLLYYWQKSTNFKPSFSNSFETTKKWSLFLDGYIVISIIAFTISLLSFFRAQTAFARNTFVCDMTNSMFGTSIPVSSTSSSSLFSCTVGVCVFLNG